MLASLIGASAVPLAVGSSFAHSSRECEAYFDQHATDIGLSNKKPFVDACITSTGPIDVVARPVFGSRLAADNTQPAPAPPAKSGFIQIPDTVKPLLPLGAITVIN
jgi:hypothetical protein